MKKYLSIIVLLFVLIHVCNAQNIDSLKHELAIATQDTSRIQILNNLASFYRMNRPDSGIYYGNKAWLLARNIESTEDEIVAMYYLVNSYRSLSNDAKALQIALEGIKIADENNLFDKKGPLLSQLGHIHRESNDYQEALHYYKESESSYEADKNYRMAAIEQSYIGFAWLRLGQPDSALHYVQLAYDNLVSLNEPESWLTELLSILGFIHLRKGNTGLAATYFKKALRTSSEATPWVKSIAYSGLAQFYKQINKPDSAAYFAQISLDIVIEGGFLNRIINVTSLLSDIYVNLDLKKSLEYSKMASAYKDSVFNLSRSSALENVFDFDEQERQYELDTAKAEYQNRLRQNIFLGSTFTLLVIAFFLYRNNKQKQKANALLKEQKEEVQSTLEKLKSTQAQLIQSEKMASLGELTAGIAHEIQNPLNFVNNFSEVSNELVDELKSEKAKGKSERDKELEEEILNDIQQNLEKINHHGKRADAIVKGMLQHSRTSSGEKEPTDINKLADEYLRLAYHGLRAKDKSLPDGQAGFNADFKTEFDESFPKINVVPQDIGRVLLNLINNAFYAVSKKAQENKEGYKPLIVVRTELEKSQLKISVSDNGPGIPADIKDKIFQPFFTTKPTGSGTGLGLSLSYDIVKAHGGTITVESAEHAGTEFIIEIPLKS